MSSAHLANLLGADIGRRSLEKSIMVQDNSDTLLWQGSDSCLRPSLLFIAWSKLSEELGRHHCYLTDKARPIHIAGLTVKLHPRHEEYEIIYS